MIGRSIHIRSVLVGMLLILGVSVLFHACKVNDEWEVYYGNTPERIDDNVLKMIGQNDNYSRFYDALVEYGFEEMLSEDQYFTLFVPVNAAFEGLPEYSASDWRKIIGFHIVFTKLFSYDFADRDLLTTIGKYLNMNKTGSNGYTLSGSAINKAQVDQYCQNGVIHEIDRLLIPKPNLYEYIMSLDDSYSILKGFLNSMDERYIDYDKSERIGVDDNGNAVYDTVWREENYFLDHIAGLNNEAEAYTGFLPGDESVNQALEAVSGYFGDMEELDEETYSQLLFITFSGSFVAKSYSFETFPDTVLSVTGKTVAKSQLNISEKNMVLSNGIVHLLGSMAIPKSYFLLPIVIECDRKENRTVSNTVYPIEELGDTRASNGSYVRYGCQFVGDYIEFRVNMVLKTTYWVVWTGPKQGPSHYQISVFDESTGNFVNIGPPVNNWTKGWFNLVISGSYTFDAFGTKQVRITIVDEAPLVGQNSIFVDYIKLIPDEIYEP